MSTNDDNTRLKRELKELAEALSNDDAGCLTCGRRHGGDLCMHCSCAVCACGDDDDDSE